MAKHSPYIADNTNLAEITVKVVVISIILTLVLAVANTYLALKIGILTSASIPAAILAMGILRLFKSANILETNLIQTAASSGEAIAGGIVFAIPAMVIIGYWQHFAYWENVFIGLVGGLLGVLFSIPIRKVLMQEKQLKFPEGTAIAEVLKAGDKQTIGLRELVLGGIVGAGVELLQTGFKLIASSIQLWFSAGRMIYGFGSGFSATMIGAGYLMGANVALSIFIGAIIANLLGVPVLSEIYSHQFLQTPPAQVAMQLYATKIRYIGVGAMLIAGVWTLITLAKPFIEGIIESFKVFTYAKTKQVLRTEKDLPIIYVFIGIIMLSIILFFLLQYSLPLASLGLSSTSLYVFLVFAILYIVFIGFIFAAITGYFSGLVGVTASPGSAILIALLLVTAILLRIIFGDINPQQLHALEAICIVIAAIVMGVAAIANDTTQDLKVGHIIGATPWKQQIMLLFGATLAALIVPPVMQLLFSVYGIAGVLPHAGMDAARSLPAPPAAVMATITEGMFRGNLPLRMIELGAMIAVVFILLNFFLQRRQRSLSLLGIAIGIYLPIATSIPLCIGGLLAYLSGHALAKHYAANTPEVIEKKHRAKQKTILIACGLVAGAALMDVVLAIPFAIYQSPNILMINLPHWHIIAEILGLAFVIGLAIWFYRSVKNM